MATSKFNPVKSAALDGILNTTNFAGIINVGLICAGPSKTGIRRSILDFDLYGLAFEGRPLRASDTITAIQLDANVTSVIGAASVPSTVERITSLIWNPNQATWDDEASGDPWTTAGGDVDSVTPTPVGYTGPAATGAFSITGLVNFGTDAISNRGGKVRLRLKINVETDDCAASGGVSRVYAMTSGGVEQATYILNGVALNVTYTDGGQPPIPQAGNAGLSALVS